MITIREMRSRYRVHGAGAEAKVRLDRLVSDLFPGAIDAAFAGAGLGRADLVCVRRVAVRLRLDLAGPDEDIAAAWSRALATEVRKMIDSRDPDVVCYASTGQAMLDMVRSLRARDASRAWAWRQLELVGADRSIAPGGSGAGEVVADALIRHPQAAPAVLAAAARAGELPWLVAATGTTAARNVAVQVMVAAGATASTARDALAEAARSLSSPLAEDDGTPAADASAETIARQVATRSQIARAMTALPEAAHDRVPWLLVSVAEIDPARLARDARFVSSLLGALGRLVRPHARGSVSSSARPRQASPIERTEGPVAHEPYRRDAPGPSASPRPRTPATRDDRFAPDSARSVSRGFGEAREAPGEAPAGVESARGGAADVEANASRGDARRLPLDQRGADVPTPGREPSCAAASAAMKEGVPRGADAHDPAHAREPRLDDTRARGTTRAGGLLFLIHVLVELDTFDELARSEALAGRLVRWSLHRLGVAIADVSDDDPAVLAFAGFPPDASPPSRGQPQASPEEREVFADLAARVLGRARERIDPTSSVSSVRHRILVRFAEIVADPGWFDVHLDPREVSTEVRRGGLDLDPGFVPAIGAVVRFHYG